MIENYFFYGSRFNWVGGAKDAPGPSDGAVHDSTVVGNTLTYEGLDAEFYDPGLAHPQIRGISVGPVDHQWLCYKPGRTMRVPLAGRDVLTGFMSGCPIVIYSEGGRRYVAHVGTEASNPSVNALVRTGFYRHLSPDATGFEPAKAWSFDEIGKFTGAYKTATVGWKVLALVTAAGAFYSILILPLQRKTQNGVFLQDIKNGDYVVAGIKQVPPISGAVLETLILPPALRFKPATPSALQRPVMGGHRR